LAELAFFGLKQARACPFAALIFLAVFLVPREGLWYIPRYDLRVPLRSTVTTPASMQTKRRRKASQPRHGGPAAQQAGGELPYGPRITCFTTKNRAGVLR
jgi:hypothetical protein